MAKNSEIISINKEVWIPDIKQKIAEWEDFSKSIFCESAEDKQSALDTADDLRKILAMVESDTLTRQQFEKLVYKVW